VFNCVQDSFMGKVPRHSQNKKSRQIVSFQVEARISSQRSFVLQVDLV
jgi:hypothetical protein